MRKLLVSVAMATAMLAVVPAAAQYHTRGHHGWQQPRGHHGSGRHAVGQLVRELDRVEQRIQRSARRGIISPREAFALSREANQVRHRLHRAGRDGLSGLEFARLQHDVNRLQQLVRLERRDRDGRRG